MKESEGAGVGGRSEAAGCRVEEPGCGDVVADTATEATGTGHAGACVGCAETFDKWNNLDIEACTTVWLRGQRSASHHVF
jgi:hypothetical protein